MRIGELARRAGASRDTIRFYERHGLLWSAPSRDASNNYRLYPEETIERLRMIMEARDAGLSIADLQLLFRHMETGGDGSFDAEAFFDGKIAEMTRIIVNARRVLAMLKQAKTALALAAHDEPSDGDGREIAAAKPPRRPTPSKSALASRDGR